MAYPNISGTTVNLIDGNLTQTNVNTEPGVLVIGRASQGPTSNIVTAPTISDASVTFGRSSEIFRGIAEAVQGGARNILAYRLAGKAPVVRWIGADKNAVSGKTGITITPTLESAEAGSIYAVAYEGAKYVSSTVSSAANGAEVTGRLMVLNKQTGRIVYFGDATRNFLDLGEVSVEYGVLDGSATVDTHTITFATTAAATGVITFVISGVTVEVPVTSGNTVTEIADAFKVAFDATDLDQVFTVTKSAGVVTITPNGVTNTAGELVYPSTHPRAGRYARLQVEGFGLGTVAGTTVAVSKTGTNAFNIGVLPLFEEDPLSVINGGQFEDLEDVSNYFTFVNTVYTGVGDGAYAPRSGIFTAGETYAETSAMKLYEQLDEAYSLLTFRSFDYVVPYGAKLNTTNVAELSSAEIITLDLESLTDYPVPTSTQDVLGKLAKVLNDDGFTYTFYWDVNNDGVAEIASDGDPSGAPSGIVFNEVSFAHQLALFCYETSTDFNFCHGVLGTTMPKSLDPRTIRTFFGKSPVSTFDGRLQKYVVPSTGNGTGLLGHKLVGGSSDYYFGYRKPGIPLTKSKVFGTMNDTESFVLDTKGNVVDLAKFISVVCAFGKLRNDFNPVRGGYDTNLAAWTAGMISRMPANESVTNKVASGVGMTYDLDPRVADEAAGARLLVLFKKGGLPTFPDGPTFAVEGSDYGRLTTMKIVAQIVKEVRAAVEPFLGSGLTTQRRAALDTALQGVMQNNTGSNIQSGFFSVRQTTAEKVLGKLRVALSIVPVFELRKVDVELSLQPGE
jgi:hypothetical protein